jgi:hypothetical protein
MEQKTDILQPKWPVSWDETRVANLLSYASTTPLDRLNWLASMLVLLSQLRSKQ